MTCKLDIQKSKTEYLGLDVREEKIQQCRQVGFGIYFSHAVAELQ